MTITKSPATSRLVGGKSCRVPQAQYIQERSERIAKSTGSYAVQIEGYRICAAVLMLGPHLECLLAGSLVAGWDEADGAVGTT